MQSYKKSLRPLQNQSHRRVVILATLRYLAYSMRALHPRFECLIFLRQLHRLPLHYFHLEWNLQMCLHLDWCYRHKICRVCSQSLAILNKRKQLLVLSERKFAKLTLYPYPVKANLWNLKRWKLIQFHQLVVISMMGLEVTQNPKFTLKVPAPPVHHFQALKRREDQLQWKLKVATHLSSLWKKPFNLIPQLCF